MKARQLARLPLTRDRIAQLATAIAHDGAKRLPKGARIVVAVTDSDGAWVGVGSNTNPRDVERILVSALRGEDRQDTPDIEAEGQEA